MELRHLRYFLAVAEERHFGRAAERLGMAQPPLSKQIQALEGELGTQLFRRVPRHLELTDAGQVFLGEARAILAHTEQAVRSAERAGRGELGRICVGFTPAASFNAFIPATIRGFRQAYPGVSMDLREADTTSLCRALSAGKVDVAFIRPPAVDFADLRIDELLDEDMLVALPTGHRLGSSVMVPLAALAGEPFILYPRWLAPSMYDGVLAACCKAGFAPNIVQEAPQVAAAINLVAAGIGISLVPASMRQIHSAGVAYRPLLGTVLRAPLSIVSRRDERSAAVRNFITLARDAVSQRRTTLAS